VRVQTSCEFDAYTEAHATAVHCIDLLLDQATAIRAYKLMTSFINICLQADLAGRDFAGERGKAVIVSTGAPAAPSAAAAARSQAERDALTQRHAAVMRIPRRPQWNAEMSAGEVKAQEQAAFLAWRRQLAQCAL
jgi:hypothetical protein